MLVLLSDCRVRIDKASGATEENCTTLYFMPFWLLGLWPVFFFCVLMCAVNNFYLHGLISPKIVRNKVFAPNSVPIGDDMIVETANSITALPKVNQPMISRGSSHRRRSYRDLTIHCLTKTPETINQNAYFKRTHFKIDTFQNVVYKLQE